MNELRALGYIPDIPKVSDYTEETATVATLLAETSVAASAAPAPALPASVDLRQYFTPIEDQGQLGGKRAYNTDFEVYDQRARDPQDSQIDIYVGVK